MGVFAQKDDPSKWLLEFSHTSKGIILNKDDLKQSFYVIHYNHLSSFETGIRAIFSFNSRFRIGGAFSINSSRLYKNWSIDSPGGPDNLDPGDILWGRTLSTILSPTLSGTAYFSFLKKPRFQAALLAGSRIGWTAVKRDKTIAEFVVIPGNIYNTEIQILDSEWTKLEFPESLNGLFTGIRFDYQATERLNFSLGITYDFYQIKTINFYAHWADFRAYKTEIRFPFSVGFLL